MKFSLRRRSALIAVPAALALALSACSVSTGSETSTSSSDTAGATKEVKKILFDYPFTALPVYTVLSSNIKKEAAAAGVEVEFTNDNMDLGQQVTNLTTYANSDVDAVVSFAVDPASLESIVTSYQKNNKLWVSYGGDVKGQDATLQFSFEESGKTLAKNAADFIQKQHGGKAKVLILQDLSIQLGKERTQGIVDGLKEYAPNAEIVAEQQAVTPEQGLSVTNTVLAKNPDVDIVLAAAGDAAQGAYQALVAAGRAENDADTYVGGLDGNLTLLEAMKAGKFVRGLVSVDSTEIAKAVIDVPVKLGKGDASVKEYNVPVHLITADSDDLDDWIATYKG